MAEVSIDKRCLKTFAVLTNHVYTVTVVQDNREVTFDFGDDAFDDSEESSIDVFSENEVSEFTFDSSNENKTKDDEFIKDDDFYFDAKSPFKSKDDKCNLSENQLNNIDNMMFKTGTGVLKCNVRDKEMKNMGRMRNYAEKHIPGISYSCSMCE